MIGKSVSTALLALLVASAAAGQEPRSMPFPAPRVRIQSLPDQAGLYGIIVAEFTRLGWKTVCVGVEADRDGGPVDPPAEVAAELKRENRSFRAMSECRQVGEDVVDRSGGADPVAVTVAGAEPAGAEYLVRVYWCCWTGWGTFRVVHGKGGWKLRRTEGWLQT